MAKLVPKLFHLYHRFTRGMTLGVRAIVIDADSRVLLVRHTYVSGWYLPGGGVEISQTFAEALEMELREEAGVHLNAPASLLNIYLNDGGGKNRDHVALYHCPDWSQPGGIPRPNHEIAEVGLFALDALPEGTSPATSRRLTEYQNGGPYAHRW